MEDVMARRGNVRDRVARELAAATGRSPDEVKLVLGAAACAAGVVILLRILKVLIDLDFGSSRNRRR
ncbi:MULTISPECIES: hypothetical protein [unclassified Nocardioides]|uniref:hypothetical protein n=1 Tax=unclassified Nocardioides TaxID=2615069 RepID=UPI00360990C7